MNFSQPAGMERINKVIASLKENNIEAEFVETGADALRRALEIIPLGAEVMTMTSVTAETIGLAKELNSSGKYNAVRPKLMELDPKSQKMQQKKLGAAAEWVTGSVHAVTENGEVIVASKTGSQLPAYVYGAGNVLWVVGAQKLVSDLKEGLERVRTYTLPLESERAKKAYGAPGSAINKLLIINREEEPGRIHMLIIGEVIGF